MIISLQTLQIPDTEWYSEEPYIDHNVRYDRFFRTVTALRENGIAIGNFVELIEGHIKDKGTSDLYTEQDGD